MNKSQNSYRRITLIITPAEMLRQIPYGQFDGESRGIYLNNLPWGKAQIGREQNDRFACSFNYHNADFLFNIPDKHIPSHHRHLLYLPIDIHFYPFGYPMGVKSPDKVSQFPFLPYFSGPTSSLRSLRLIPTHRIFAHLSNDSPTYPDQWLEETGFSKICICYHPKRFKANIGFEFKNESQHHIPEIGGSNNTITSTYELRGISIARYQSGHYWPATILKGLLTAPRGYPSQHCPVVTHNKRTPPWVPRMVLPFLDSQHPISHLSHKGRVPYGWDSNQIRPMNLQTVSQFVHKDSYN